MLPLLRKAAIAVALKKGLEAVSEMREEHERARRPLWRRLAPLGAIVAGGALAAFLVGSGRVRSPFSGTGTSEFGTAPASPGSLTDKVIPQGANR